MSKDTGLDNISTPVAILIGSVIIGGSIIFAASRMMAPYSPSPATANNPTVQPAGQTQPQKAANIKTVKTNSPTIGSANAPIVMAYWYDYKCSFCKLNDQNVISRVVTDYVNTGKIRVMFKDFQFLSADSTKIGIVGRAVYEVAPNRYYDWHKVVFENLGKVASDKSIDVQLSELTTLALGKDISVKVIALSVSKADEYKKAMDAEKSEGSTYGVRSTPTMMIGNQLVVGAKSYDEIKPLIEAALKR